VYTIDFRGAAETMKLLKPAVTIPMHFKTDVLTFRLDGADKFLAAAGSKSINTGRRICVKRENFRDFPGIVVMNYQ
jgi:L-ascorbate metabolism protein UlaG (beta-lactamase superfamily)